MAIPLTPDFWPMSLGAAADAVTIPAQTPSGQGIPSFQEIFPTLTAVDPAAGGYFIEREWMNGLFQLLGANVWFMQHGGRFAWTNRFDYPVGAVVQGSDGQPYVAVAVSGPDSGGAADPTADTGTHWAAMPGAETERWRRASIGRLDYFVRGTLPAGWMACDRSLALFADYPEFEAAYNAGAFDGMVLEATASAEDKQAGTGKFVKNAATPTGLYLPGLSGLFVRGAGTGTAGKYNAAGVPNITGVIYNDLINIGPVVTGASGACAVETGKAVQSWSANALEKQPGETWYEVYINAQLSNALYGASSTVMPPSVDLAVGIYLGRTA